MWWPDGRHSRDSGGVRNTTGWQITQVGRQLDHRTPGNPMEKENQPRARTMYGKNQQVVELIKSASSENASRLLEIKKNSKHKL